MLVFGIDEKTAIRYAGSASAVGRQRRETVRMQAAEVFEQKMRLLGVVRRLRVSGRCSGRLPVAGLIAMRPGSRTWPCHARKGRIVNVSSIGGRLTFPFQGAYQASKFAVEALSDVLRFEVAPFGIQVSVVEPGPVSTRFLERASSNCRCRRRRRENRTCTDCRTSAYPYTVNSIGGVLVTTRALIPGRGWDGLLKRVIGR
ncbi:SDR family NAD(P)-dependent oxidoreductase [Streptomyces shenzhenensis]|uniref:SDR family NAD(P)-dependent oxidoreductase n=1 Tax=Streptomyces shenzhenensis TaxID=943815 RepID=UPI003826FED5